MNDLQYERRPEALPGFSGQRATQPFVMLCNPVTGMFGIFQLSVQRSQTTIESLAPIQSQKMAFLDPLSGRRFWRPNLMLISLQFLSDRLFWFHLYVRPSSRSTSSLARIKSQAQ